MPRAIGAAVFAALVGFLSTPICPSLPANIPRSTGVTPRPSTASSGSLQAGSMQGWPSVCLWTELPTRLLGWATWTVRQFFPWGFLVALFGLWRLDRRLHAWWLATLLIFLAFTIYALGYNTTDSLTYLIPAFAVMALWFAEGLSAAFLQLRSRPAAFAALLMLAMIAVPIALGARNWRTHDLHGEDIARAFIASALTEAEPNSVILTAGDERTFALWYGIYGLGKRPDVALLNVNLYGYEWYRRSLAETHPDLLPFDGSAPPLESLIITMAAERPVYAAEDLGLNLPEQAEPGEATHSSGVLTRLPRTAALTALAAGSSAERGSLLREASESCLIVRHRPPVA